MPIDRPASRNVDHPARQPDRTPEASPDQVGAESRSPDTSMQFTETRSRATYYAELRAADNDPLAELHESKPGTDEGISKLGWKSPELADHPDRPALDAVHVPPERMAHILGGDSTGGGHRHGAGRPGETEFPAAWSDQKIMDSLISVALSPDSAHLQRNGRWRTEGSRDGVKLVVVVRPDGHVWTAYPLPGSPGVTQNPRNR